MPEILRSLKTFSDSVTFNGNTTIGVAVDDHDPDMKNVVFVVGTRVNGDNETAICLFGAANEPENLRKIGNLFHDCARDLEK